MADETAYRATKAVIHTAAIEHNAKQMLSCLPRSSKLIAVVKADGYGHGAHEAAAAALRAGAAMLAVATPDEAAALRRKILDAPILVLGPSPVEFVRFAAENNIAVTVMSSEWVKRLAALEPPAKKCKVHVKIDSGMGRIGVRTKEELLQLIEEMKHAPLLIEGVFTHFARADEENPQPTREQFRRFTQLAGSFPEKPPLIHAANSAAAFLYPEYALDAVRFGIGLYGIAPSAFAAGKLPFQLKRALTLETALSYVKKMPAGEAVSYGGSYVTQGDEWIGTLPIGYADGLKRSLTGQEVLIGGERAPIIGTICMDQCMVKLPREYPEGEKVVLIGRQGNEEITLEEWADRLHTIPYEVAVTFSKRITKEYR